MTGSNFEINLPDETLAGEGYVRYLGGVAYLHDPVATENIHNQPFDQNKELFVARAEVLMLEGARQVIRYSNDPAIRDRMLNMEDGYQDALGHMEAVVDQAFVLDPERGDLLMDSIRYFRPAAFLHENIYRYICHGRLGKIATAHMMDGVFPHEEFREIIEGRKLAKPA
ncbi:MAG TPA: hypothetical protein VFX79_03560 [Candidatus Saccharimonadales bacterium]|nr:hypothetical protein [Candidatus Saccharimonadales bacterium]